jgi:hypothetical protein
MEENIGWAGSQTTLAGEEPADNDFGCETIIFSTNSSQKLCVNRKVQLKMYNTPIGCYLESCPGQIVTDKEISVIAADRESRAVRNRILLCWLTLTIPLILYLKFTYWDQSFDL